MVYDLTNLTNATNIYTQTEALNSLSGGLFSILLIVSFFIILFVALKKYEEDTAQNLMTASAITTIISILLWSIGFVEWYIVMFPIIIFFGSLMVYKFLD